MKKYALGLDFGTNSCRSLIVDLDDGSELAESVFAFPSGETGILLDEKDPNVARQNPQDYIQGIEITIKNAITKACEEHSGFDPYDIIGIGVDTTASSPIPVDSNGTPLCMLPEFRDNLNAMVWLWKDHTSYEEANEITELALKLRPQYMARIGGTYSSEWYWSKILRCLRKDRDVFNAAYSFVECCDWIPAILAGNTKPDKICRSICAAGHKAMFDEQWGGLPDKDFLSLLSPDLAVLRERLFNVAFTSDCQAGGLSNEWAEKLGLKPGTAVAVGGIDAHMGAVGAGVKKGTLVKILGTSTCDIMVWPNNEQLDDIKGVCGIVDGSVIPGYFGIEAGQPAVGDIFLWFINNFVPESYGKNTDEKFKQLSNEAAKQKPGEHGLLALDWNNGNRSVLVDVRLTGLILGQTLHTQPHEIYRALIEATAFGALTIINRIEEHGVKVEEIVNCGGLAAKNPLLMQIYADITGRPMKLSQSDQSPALGAAIFGALAAGEKIRGFKNIEDAQKKMAGIKAVYNPIPDNHEVYKKLHQLYVQLHSAFGTKEWKGNLYNVMKSLLELRDKQRNKN